MSIADWKSHDLFSEIIHVTSFLFDPSIKSVSYLLNCSDLSSQVIAIALGLRFPNAMLAAL